MTMQEPTYVGVYDNREQAEQAIEFLQNAGFTPDQMSYSGITQGGGLLGTLKQLFTGTATGHDAVVNDLMGMGLARDEAQYYAQQHEVGRPIVAIHPYGRGEEVKDILLRTGAHDFGMKGSDEDAMTNKGMYTQPGGYNQAADYNQAMRQQFDYQQNANGMPANRQGDYVQSDQQAANYNQADLVDNYGQTDYQQQADYARVNQNRDSIQPGYDQANTNYGQWDANRPADYAQGNQAVNNANYAQQRDMNVDEQQRMSARQQQQQADEQRLSQEEIRRRQAQQERYNTPGDTDSVDTNQ